MTINRKLNIAIVILVMMLAALCVYGGPVLRLGWTACPDVDGYRVFAGPTSRGWDTNWFVTNTTTNFEVPDIGRWFFVVRAERNPGSITNLAVSDMSAEVMFELLQEPQIEATPHVALTTVFQSSRNLTQWQSRTSAPTWLAATNEQEFYRNPELRIEKAMIPAANDGN